MKKLFFATFVLFLLTSTIFASNALADRNPINSYVRFGDPMSGFCTGKGICSQTGSDAIPVTFTYVSHNSMVISFSLADLSAHQPDQVEYFYSSSYIFDTHFNLNSATFGAWNLGAGAWINVTSNSSVSIVNGIVYDTVEIEYYY